MKHLLAAVVALGLAVPAFAQTFDEADADGSGTVSLEELQAVLPDVTQEEFEAADMDGDGELNQEEFDTFMAGR